jgi:nucleoside-diphosphate-sugar epimerase
MRVFVTGGTGFVGSAVVRELVGAGHEVTGLARSDPGAETLARAGVKVQRGSLDDLESLRRGADASDGVIHLAFGHDFSKFPANCEIDRHAIEALGSTLQGSDRPLVVTSATGLLPPGTVGTEAETPTSASTPNPRVATEEAVAVVADLGVRASVVRLAMAVHGDGGFGFVARLVELARRTGVSAYVDGGSQRWSAIHRLDAAHLFRSVLESGASARRFHGVAEQGIPLREIATVIGRHLDVPVVSKSSGDAAGHFGWFAGFVALDSPASSELTRRRLGWRPTQPGLLADLESPRAWTA